ncbi:hypothetical protein M406DRAFT_67964 [Cryphonectria parasitica EP155]|uniref:Uncharacterized protein n=1 Tax=Cryphonectria parasitica (strain ATCC 38755 / EP155) TaxID=660469 RepID=A0A9P5CQ07_CRYP1|nr:uncharacterized protein M406DRAFT_67964 [Cryphonectria parasitica EP155]KAF3765530.1 hypothetical protein M406DRAFT_67964 [Cryphonectria parasitica EP155]
MEPLTNSTMLIIILISLILATCNCLLLCCLTKSSRSGHDQAGDEQQQQQQQQQSGVHQLNDIPLLDLPPHSRPCPTYVNGRTSMKDMPTPPPPPYVAQTEHRTQDYGPRGALWLPWLGEA